jgi:DnaK suppressor protein
VTGTGLDDAALARLRDALEEHRTSLRHEIREQGIDPDSEDLQVAMERGFADGGHTTAERGQMLTLVRELRESLRDVERALVKVDRGAYGTCERCGGPVGAERLEAIPWARLCMRCKQAR